MIYKQKPKIQNIYDTIFKQTKYWANYNLNRYLITYNRKLKHHTWSFYMIWNLFTVLFVLNQNNKLFTNSFVQSNETHKSNIKNEV